MWESVVQGLLKPTWTIVGLGGLAAFLVGLSLGLWARRSRVGKLGDTGTRGDPAFLKGFQYILSNDQDQAIEEFTKSVQVNSETVETYVALGNLYRSKGNIDRAIRIRQSILLRAGIDSQTRLRALFDLGLDYRKGGFLNRALETFLKVIDQDPANLAALREIERLYEETRDWEGAFGVREKISRLSKGEHTRILAHHLVEMGKEHMRKGEPGKAKPCFTKAISMNKKCVDAYLHLGDLYFENRDYKKAMGTWKRVAEETPQFTFLAYRRIESAYATMQDLRSVGDFLRECARLNSDAFSHVALARYLWKEDDMEGALIHLNAALQIEPTFWEAGKFKAELLLHRERKEEALGVLQDLVARLDLPYLKFQCTQCGFRPSDLHWQCPQCNSWDTVALVEQRRMAGVPTGESPLLQPNPYHETEGA